MNRTDPAPDLTVVVPVSEPPTDLRELFDEYLAALESLGQTYELIVVVDGGQAWAVPELEEIRGEHPAIAIEIVVLGRTFGEAACLSVGFRRSRGKIVATLPSYAQVDSADLTVAIDAVHAGADIAVGNRQPRIDSLFNRIQAGLFHSCVRLFTGVPYHDISNGLRAMRPEIAHELEIYGDLHRFIPIIAQSQGFKVAEVDVRQSKRQAKVRVERLGAYIRRVLDLLTVFFLAKFTRKPLRFFGLIGTTLLIPGLATVAYLGLYRILGFGGIANRPLLLLGVLMMVLGFQTLCIGMLGEVIIFVHARNLREYSVAEVIGRTPARPRDELLDADAAVVDRSDESVRG